MTYELNGEQLETPAKLLAASLEQLINRGWLANGLLVVDGYSIRTRTGIP